ncbi:enoyl-CoA hydratase/isomerase family protein [Alteromonas sp. 345S023]|uniref:Enoyl-CoA hydratase/isomerase family protein n=1 Tax=Alteromonas profundi TaxID=2696062 RepID=A0A7X5RK90_9ALTE|nr:enoyl-CoA hydratase/isomerase family protein [Alteromonas profundi]NDV90481.1 enoyl-CoA hydratase/isomerase family protein [Alteromonas profundi]
MNNINSTAFNEITVRHENGVLYIHFNRPQKKNAMNLKLVEEVMQCFQHTEEITDLRAVVIAGSEGNFCSGGDISDMHLSSLSESEKEQAIWHFNRSFGHMITQVKHSPTPVIAVVQGAVLGGGFGLACVADIAIACETAFFSLPETGLGIIPAQIAPFVASRIGVDQTKRLALTGEKIDAQQALQLGLVHRVCPPSQLTQQLTSEIKRIKRCAPTANKNTKRLLLGLNETPLEQLLDNAADAFVNSLTCDEGVEGTKAFIQKRSPSWCE